MGRFHVKMATHNKCELLKDQVSCRMACPIILIGSKRNNGHELRQFGFGTMPLWIPVVKPGIGLNL